MKMNKLNQKHFENFQTLVDLAMQNPGRDKMRPIVEKELLHYDILFALDRSGLLKDLTFQGGTALRLCYGGVRYSEDLDFTGGKNFNNDKLMQIKNCLEKYIGERYGLNIIVKEPRDFSTALENTLNDSSKNLLENPPETLKVSRWQVSITTAPERKDLPKQKIKLEIINVPSYSRIPRLLISNYDFLPDGYSDTLILTESLDEIMADKLIAFVNSQKYIRYRDIWDLHWLKQQNAEINPAYLISKINDYGIINYKEKLLLCLNQLEALIKGDNFKHEMGRFIPLDIRERTLLKPDFIEFLYGEIRGLLENILI